MSKSDEYWAKADECQRMAGIARKPGGEGHLATDGGAWPSPTSAPSALSPRCPGTRRYFKLLTSSTVLYSAG